MDPTQLNRFRFEAPGPTCGSYTSGFILKVSNEEQEFLIFFNYCITTCALYTFGPHIWLDQWKQKHDQKQLSWHINSI